MSFPLVSSDEGSGGAAIAAPISDSDDYSISENESDSDSESVKGGENLDAEQEEFNAILIGCFTNMERRKWREHAN